MGCTVGDRRNGEVRLSPRAFGGCLCDTLAKAAAKHAFTTRAPTRSLSTASERAAARGGGRARLVRSLGLDESEAAPRSASFPQSAIYKKIDRGETGATRISKTVRIPTSEMDRYLAHTPSSQTTASRKTASRTASQTASRGSKGETGHTLRTYVEQWRSHGIEDTPANARLASNHARSGQRSTDPRNAR